MSDALALVAYGYVLGWSVAWPPGWFAGGFAREDHIFKALALGAPYVKLVCMGRAPMIPGFLGSNIEAVFKPDHKAELSPAEYVARVRDVVSAAGKDRSAASARLGAVGL